MITTADVNSNIHLLGESFYIFNLSTCRLLLERKRKVVDVTHPIEPSLQEIDLAAQPTATLPYLEKSKARDDPSLGTDDPPHLPRV
ncbi:hypothetical protein Cob_v006230 [Colletotrichum orbiculare MAFF 240422]|uniref:Uncharacterized protein n=1 Tax=Colletotrichum orbiculare (strain 104-T / ATCC 96160 / CBS 514.97 / LARS 414 / MAFF 240422) TaxID=1213857 RepID=A0A484FSD0_COLOR|nr:hypothetical protein Cob_v006230 [Colletotrichum orbiculare MAFF 240422]